MEFRITNKSNLNLEQMTPLLKSFLPFAQKNMGFNRTVDINFVSDSKNANNPLGKTAFYDPNLDSVTIYTDKRHPKDILRSLSHELVHHAQNCKGKFDNKPHMGEDYFQYNKYMQEMEREAYEKGNMTFRDWEEKHRKQLQESIYYKTGETQMSHKEWKNEALFGRLMESFGYQTPKSEGISHLCATLVTEKKSGRVGHPINHTLLEDGTVTHYDVEFDDVIIEGMPVEKLDVEVQQEHMHAEDREDYEHGDKPRKKFMEEEELAEAHCGRREDEDEVMEEEAKPDFPDVAGDGDTKEPISKASKEKKEKEGGEKKDKDLSKVPPQLRKHVAKNMNEAQIRRIVREAFSKAFKK